MLNRLLRVGFAVYFWTKHEIVGLERIISNRSCVNNIKIGHVGFHCCIKNIGLRHIRYFVAVAEELHFWRAGEKLGADQPALIRTIGNLESELGVALFVRTNRNVQIANAGKNSRRDALVS